MNKQEAERIAAVVNLVRPDWSTSLLMTVLGDDRMKHRTYADAIVAMVAMAADTTSKRPGRIHENGRWWMTVTAMAPPTSYHEVTDSDCLTCGHAKFAHPLSPTDPHQWEPQHARTKGVGPTPEQRAAIDKAAADAAYAAAAAAKEEAAKKEHRDMNDVIASHIESNGDAA